MRILLLSCSFPPIGGMTPLLAAQFARELVRRGHDVDVLTIDPSERHPVYLLLEAEADLDPTDELAAAASLLMGQADEGCPAVLARGFPYARRASSIGELIRPRAEDLFR